MHQLQLVSPSPLYFIAFFFCSVARSKYSFIFLRSFIFTQCSIKYYYYFTVLRVFHASVSGLFFTRVWVTASLLKSPGLFSVFWPILVMLKSRWSLLVHWFLSRLVPLSIFWELFLVHQLQLVSPLPPCSIGIFLFLDINLSFRNLIILLCGLPGSQCPLFGRFSILFYYR